MADPAFSLSTVGYGLGEVNTNGKLQSPDSEGRSVYRVCFVMHSMPFGGVEKVRSVLCKGLLKEKNFKVDLVTLHHAGEMLHRIPGGVRLFTFDQAYFRKRKSSPNPPSLIAADRFDLLWLWRAWVKGRTAAGVMSLFRFFNPKKKLSWPLVSQMANYIDRHQPDVIIAHCHQGSFFLIPYLGRKIACHKPKLIGSLHGGPYPLRRSRLLSFLPSWLYYKKVHEILPEIDLILTVSKGVADDFVSRTGANEKKVVTIYNPVPLEDISSLKQRKPSLPPWLIQKDGIKTIISAGRLAQKKDQGTLLRAFHLLSKRRKVRLIILGEGCMRKSLERLACKLAIEEQVFLPGYTDNPFAWFAESDVFVLSSIRNEGLPNILIEALACGLPVVSTDCPYGPREILQDGRFGKLVPMRSAEKLAAAIEETLDAPKNTEALVGRARDFSEDVIIPQYQKILWDVLGAGA